MPGVSDCCSPCCATTPPVNIPGSPGAPGAAGAAGPNLVDATTVTTLNGILKGDGANVGVLADPLPLANGGTGTNAANMAALLTAILGASIVPVANGGTGFAAAPIIERFSQTDPTLTASPTQVMMGLADAGSQATPALFTPATSGKVLVMVTGTVLNATVADGAQVQLYIGPAPGSTPANGAVVPGAAIPLGKVKSVGIGQGVPFTLAYVATGLTVGNQYWVDVALNHVTGGNASITSIDILAIEL